MKRLLILLLPLGLVLSVAVSVQLWDATLHPAEVTKSEPLEAMIPRDVPGWRCEDLPIAQTEEVMAAALEELNFSDYVSRIYRRGNTEVILYIAYWEPLKMPIRLVGSHTPDVCWVANGWKCERQTSNVYPELGTRMIKSAEYREFSSPETYQYLYFWHMIGEMVYKAPNRLGQWDRWNMLTDLFRFGLNQKKEQFFVRVSANKPLTTVWDDPGFSALMEAVAKTAQLIVPLNTQPNDWTRAAEIL